MDRMDKHKIKMLAKEKMRDYFYDKMGGPKYIPANLSRNHPDYGMSMKDHLTEKAKRNSEKSS